MYKINIDYMGLNPPKFKIIIGLGNPDKQYENTYHNVGHLFIDFLTKSSKALPAGKQVKAKSLKTDVYMNESGIFVSKIIRKNGIKPENLIVVHDDSDIFLGDYKLSFNHSSAGHKGIESVIKNLGTQKFWRIRIGIRPQLKEDSPSQSSAGIARRSSLRRAKAGEFVLKKITASNKKILGDVFQKITEELSG